MKKDIVINKSFYWELFKATFLVSAFTVGGGFVIIPILKAKFVDHYHWLDEDEALNLVSIAQSAPGVISINAAIIIGYRLAGILGACIAVFATVLPPLFIMTTIAFFYNAFSHNKYVQFVLQGMQCGATALILHVAYDLINTQVRKKVLLPILIIVATFIGDYVFDINIMYLIIVDAFIGLAILRDSKYS